MRNLKIRTCVGVVAITTMFALVGCTEKATPPIKAKAPATSADIDPRSQVIGVEAGGPAKDTPQTTSAAKSDISKAQEASAMPMAGQANDHSTLSPKATQKPPGTGK